MKEIKYYVFYNNNLKAITVLDVGKFTRLYNNEILSPSSNDKNYTQLINILGKN